LNDEIGAPIRTTGDPNTAVMSINHNFVGQPVFSMFQIMEGLRQARTGISDASKGVDPRALQSTNVTGIDAIVQGAQERIELCARILAETGMKQLFRGLLREIVAHPNQERTIQLRGKWVTVDPSTFDPTMRISINPTLGKGSDMTRLMVLQDVKQTQTTIMTQFGVENPLCGIQEFRNTLTDILAIANVKNVGRYYREIDEATVKKIAETPKEPDAATLLAQSEMEKNRVKMATEISKSNFADRKLRVDDDFRRDDMMVTGILDAMKIEAQFAVDVNEEEFKSENTPVSREEPLPLPVPAYAQELMRTANGNRQPVPEEPIGPAGTPPPQ
jgi:predicted transposase YbfD/YdcC